MIPLGILSAQLAGAGGGGAYDLLETVSLSTSASSVTFSGLGSYSDYKHLQIRWLARNGGSTSADMLFRINGDTGFNYARHRLRGDGSSVASNASTGDSTIYLERGNTYSGSDTRVFASGIMDILDYSSTSKNTTVRAMLGQLDPNAGINYVALVSGLWTSTAAITSLTYYPDSSGTFASGTRFSLYGVKG